MSQSLSQNEQNINFDIAKLNVNADKANSSDAISTYVIFKIHTNIFALNCKYVQSIEPTPNTITEVSQSSDEIRGVSYYKEQAINLIDLRKVLGIISQKEYFSEVVDIPRRIQDYLACVESVEHSILNEQDISVSGDPSECDFGKWIDNYVSKTPIVKNEIDRISESHKLVHKSFRKIQDALSAKRIDDASNILETIKNEHSKYIVERLNELEKTLYSDIKELSIIVHIGNKTLGLIVDETESVESINSIQRLPEVVIVSEYIKNYGLRNKDDSLLLILEASAFA